MSLRSDIRFAGGSRTKCLNHTRDFHRKESDSVIERNDAFSAVSKKEGKVDYYFMKIYSRRFFEIPSAERRTSVYARRKGAGVRPHFIAFRERKLQGSLLSVFTIATHKILLSAYKRPRLCIFIICSFSSFSIISIASRTRSY